MQIVAPVDPFKEEDSAPLIKTPLAAGAQATGNPPAVDPAILVFLYLLEAASTSADSALMRAKKQNQIAMAEQKDNKEASALTWERIPTVEQTAQHRHWRSWVTQKPGPGPWWNAFIPIPTRHTSTKWTPGKIVNASAIAIAQSQNQAMFAMRGVLEDKLTVLQQSSSIGETGISTQSQESMQAMQEGSGILQIVQDLTFKAELRQAPAT